MKRAFLKRAFLAALLVPFAMSAAVAHAERTPAQFGTGEKSLDKLIEFPELKGDASVIILCASLIEDNGNMDKNGCVVEKPGDEIFVKAIVDAADDATARPAVVDGRKKQVYLQYRVQFDKKGDKKTVTLYPNPGVQENVDAYGQDYVAAQRVIGDERWQKECPEQASYLVWLKAHVGPDGEQSNLSLTHAGGLNPTPHCRQAILDTVSGSLFFPALADGQPVQSTYVEPFGN